MKKLCTIYKSPREEEMYLYVDTRQDLETVPEALLERFGAPVLVTKLILTPDKKLARADTAKVIQQIDQAGFYLQMPPIKEDYMDEINKHNSKLAR